VVARKKQIVVNVIQGQRWKPLVIAQSCNFELLRTGCAAGLNLE
jgi:hypothetical protein